MTITRPDAPVAQAHAGADTTEADAQQRSATRAGVLRDRVLRILAVHADGLTAAEVHDAYRQLWGEPLGGLYSLSPRLSELSRPGADYVSKTTRRRGRRAIYQITDKGTAWIGQTAAHAA